MEDIQPSENNKQFLLISRICELCIDLIEYLNKIPHDAYHYQNKEFEDATLGQHCRHICDRIYCFLSGVQQGFIDYDNRKRQKILEQDVTSCSNFLNNVITNLQKLANMDISKPIMVKETIDIHGNTVEVESTIERELLECNNHMIHHLAFVRLILFSMGFALSDTLGFSPASVIYNRSQLSPQQLEALLEQNHQINNPHHLHSQPVEA